MLSAWSPSMSAWCQRLCSLATRSRTLAVSRLLVLSCSAPYTFLLYLDTRVSPASTWHVSSVHSLGPGQLLDLVRVPDLPLPLHISPDVILVKTHHGLRGTVPAPPCARCVSRLLARPPPAPRPRPCPWRPRAAPASAAPPRAARPRTGPPPPPGTAAAARAHSGLEAAGNCVTLSRG